MNSRRGWEDRYTKVESEAFKDPDEVENERIELAVSKVFQYGKTTVPKSVRVKLEVNEGDKLIWSVDDTGNIIVSKGYTG